MAVQGPCRPRGGLNDNDGNWWWEQGTSRLRGDVP